MPKVVDLFTRVEVAIDGEEPIRNEGVAEVLQETMKLNDEGRIAAVIVVFVDEDCAPSYALAHPSDMPPNIFIGALEMTKQAISHKIVGVPRSPEGA